jgi:YegS/Rv2252/BmrU family lipid kinase
MHHMLQVIKCNGSQLADHLGFMIRKYVNVDTDRTLIILNPHAGSGRAGRLWTSIEPLLWDELGELVVAVTERPEDVAEHLDKARDAGLTRVVAIGGDGTNHAIVNAIQDLQERDPDGPPMTFAQLPMGTGRDFARTLGTPFEPEAAVKWIAHARPRNLDIGRLTIDENQHHYFLNIASAGIGGEIAARVNRTHKRRFWTFHLATLKTLFAYHPQHFRVWLDGEMWYDEDSWEVVVANGRIFGHGMLVAPYAEIDDGQFDVIAVEGMPKWKATIALNSIYSGAHLKRQDVHYKKAKEVVVEGRGQQFALELDGETAYGEHLQFSVKPGALRMLVGEEFN